MRKREIVNKLNLIIVIGVKFWSIFPKKVLKKFFKFFSGMPGYLGLYFRYTILKNIAKSCGNNVYIGEKCFFYNIDNIEIGNNVSIHPMSYINAVGGLKIGDDVSIAHNTSIITFEHNYFGEKCIKDNPIISNEVIIGSDVWIGAGVRILSGTKINDRCIIGAGAVVKDEIQGNSIYAGIPAKLIKKI